MRPTTVSLTTILAGIVLGGVVGWACQRLPIRPILASVFAVVVAWLLTTIVAAAVWMLLATRDPHSDIWALSVDFMPLAYAIAEYALLAIGVHVALGWVGAAGYALVGQHRVIIVAVIGGVLAALLFGYHPVQKMH